jgi:phosphoenolpyruvate synthase/pyruvate phosphate dikinase
MNPAKDLNNKSPGHQYDLDLVLEALLYHLRSYPQKKEEIKKHCRRLSGFLSTSTDKIDFDKIKCILPLLKKSKGEIKDELFPVCSRLTARLTDPWMFIEDLFTADDEEILMSAVDLFGRLISEEIIKVDERITGYLAVKQDSNYSLYKSAKVMGKLASVLDEVTKLDEIFIGDKNSSCRILAAKLLDALGRQPDENTAEILLGKEAADFLSPYLEYTRAAYLDLYSLIPYTVKSRQVVHCLIECEKICGKDILKEVIAKLGWQNLNSEISVKLYYSLSYNESIPLFLSANEALILEAAGYKRTSEVFLFTASAGLTYDKSSMDNDISPVALFRKYNLAQASLLGAILDVAPLTVSKVNNIISKLDKIVEDYIKLFQKYSEECSIIPDVYQSIKSKILKGIEEDAGRTHLSADVTRLVQMFENPFTLGEVHTLHGLKRYLHQKGLQLGFKLVDQSRSPTRSISIVLASENRVLSVIKKINYANFEPDPEDEFLHKQYLYPVIIVVDGFARQILHGAENFPLVNIFCYGNEVHYFVWFRNHPVFIRIDFSPPLQGGMIDLQYFGVSNYELADHPNLSLDAIKYFFRNMEFDVELEGTHIHARYDKERALDIKQLCERAEYLFSLAPYLMDLDWIIGSLNMGMDVKQKVIKGWAELFKVWGVIPVNKILSKDRLGILQDVLITAEGESELVWNGEGSYKDRYDIRVPEGLIQKILAGVDAIGIKVFEFAEEKFSRLGQLFLEKKIFSIIRNSLDDGEIIETPEGFKKTSEDKFKKYHEAEEFTGIISGEAKQAETAAALAKVIQSLEQLLKFRTTGMVAGFKVESSLLPVLGEYLTIFVLRDHKEIIRLAFYIHGINLHIKKDRDGKLRTNASISPSELTAILRYNNYNTLNADLSADKYNEEIKGLKDQLLQHITPVNRVHIPDEKIITGLRASPGRAAGRVLLGSAGRAAGDFREHIFAASSVSPGENTIIYHSSGVIATGGGILSHAGLIATQFKKPALIISGEWKQQNGTLLLLYRTLEHDTREKKLDGYNLTMYYNFREREYQMQDGDLVVLDADNGFLQNYGQERDTITLFDNLKSLGIINEEITNVEDLKELLVLRGRKLHYRHQLEKLLKRISEPSLIKFAVQEILTGNFLDGRKSTPGERTYLLSLFEHNDKAIKPAGDFISEITCELKTRYIKAYTQAEKIIPAAQYIYEVIIPRLEVLRLYHLLKNLFPSEEDIKDIYVINSLSAIRLQELRDSFSKRVLEFTGYPDKKRFIRHLSKQIDRIDILLNASVETEEQPTETKNISDKYIITSEDGSFEFAQFTGWKAANLAEIEWLSGKGLVPPWYVVTDNVFQFLLDTNVNGSSLFETIQNILIRTDAGNKEKSMLIRKLWNSVTLPDKMKSEIIREYRKLERIYSDSKSSKKQEIFFAAVRSSSCEEDAEIAAGAGEFETYLYINGEDDLINHLNKTWSGLWTERAIHNRSAAGNENIRSHGGVIIQQMVWSRVSGVLQTINVAKGDMKEMVINAGLGLGEGIVSGAVAADQIIVSKEGDLENGPLNFSYITADKENHVVFDKKAGYGTRLMPVLYHQRFRPALEYVELCELVAAASRLESAYGYPLDIEFGIEGTKLWILQVRPVAVFLPALRETIEHYPFTNLIYQEIHR